MQHPFDALLVVAVDHAADELEHDVVQRLAGGDFADRVDQRAVADHERHRGEQVGLRGARGDVVRVGRGDGARLLHRERDAFGDQEARLVGHVAMAAEREGEVRLQPARTSRDSRRTRGSAPWPRSPRRAMRSGSLTPITDDVRHRQQRVQIERRVPVRHADQNDAHVRPPDNPVIARSEATRQSPSRCAPRWRLLRRFAPRNDRLGATNLQGEGADGNSALGELSRAVLCAVLCRARHRRLSGGRRRGRAAALAGSRAHRRRAAQRRDRCDVGRAAARDC